MGIRAVIQSTGSAAPDRVMTNHDIAKLVETSDEWIVQRTGISERRVSGPTDTSASLATKASRIAIERAGVDPLDIDLVVCGTVTPDMIFPSAACMVQDNIGAKNAGAFDLGAACAGFIYSLGVTAGMIESGRCRRALVIGVDVLTKYVDWTDRSVCVLFGDGAGAVIVEAAENTERGVLDTALMADGAGGKFINFEYGGSLHPVRDPASLAYRQSIFMAGQETYKFAVNAMGDACNRALAKSGLSVNDVDLFVPHQANIRIIESAADRLKIPRDKVFVNVQKYGNTSGGSVPLALDEAVTSGRLQPGMIAMTVGFGAGLVWGANIIRW